MKRRAFTLVELLVVISIIGLLSSIAAVSLGASREKARNAQRKANLVQISKALELYYADNGAYPSTGGAEWSIVISGHDASSGSGAWIPGLAPTYTATLPKDPLSQKLNPRSPASGCQSNPWTYYIYISTVDNYKLIANCTPEGA